MIGRWKRGSGSIKGTKEGVWKKVEMVGKDWKEREG